MSTPPGWQSRWSSTGWLSLPAVAVAAVMFVTYRWDGQAYLVDDKRNQYLPVMMDIGRRILSGEWLPVIDPNLGISGNYSLDIQYGLYEPTHWLVALGLSRFTDLQLAAFLWALVFEVVFAVGTTALARRLRMSGPWAATAGFAAATSGYVFFQLAPDWMPGLVSIAWLPWVWWAWTGTERGLRVRECLGVAVFSYLVVAGGWPSTWLTLGALIVGLVVEAVASRETGAGLRSVMEPVALRGAALLAGVVSAGLCVVPLLHAAAFTNRKQDITNNNFLTGNLADMFSFAAPQLDGDILTFDHQAILIQPIYFAAWFAVVVLWCTRWNRSLWRRPGLVTCVVGSVAMLLLTQAPSTFGPLRDQIRQLSGLQLFFVVGICAVASAGRWTVTRLRIAGILLSLAAMGWLSWARHPQGPHSFIGILAVMVTAGLLVLCSTRSDRLTALVALASTFGLTLAAFGVYRADTIGGLTQDTDRLTAGTLRLTPADEPVFAAYDKGDRPSWDVWQDDGVGRAFSDLRPHGRLAPGYSSISQAGFRQQMCILTAQGQGCPAEINRLFQREKLTDVPWDDLLGYKTILVEGAARQAKLAAIAPPDWHLVMTGAAFQEWQRSGPTDVAGRVTDVIGSAEVKAESVTNETQTYDVSTVDGARLVFRDLFWPGYVATLDGKRIPVSSLDRTLLTVQLPAGTAGRLQVSYDPLSTKMLVLLPGTSVVLLTLVCGWVFWRRRQAGEDSPGVDGEQEAAEPADGDGLKHPV